MVMEINKPKVLNNVLKTKFPKAGDFHDVPDLLSRKVYNLSEGKRSSDLIDPNLYFEFNSLAKAQQNLSYVVLSFIDLKEMQKDFEVDLNISDRMNYRMTSFNVLADTKLALTYNRWLINNSPDNFWDGPVSSEGNNYTTKSNEQNVQPVYKNIQQVQFNSDKRIVDTPTRVVVLHNLEHLYNVPPWERLLTEQAGKSSLFTLPMSCFNKDREIKILFGLDYKNICREASAYTGLFENTDELYQYIKIKSLKIFRTNLAENSPAGGDGMGGTYPNPKPKLIVETSDLLSYAKLQNTKTIMGELSEPGGLRSMPRHVRFFKFRDTDAKDKSRGKFIYKIDMKIEDKIFQDLLKPLVRELERHGGVGGNLQTYKLLSAKYYNHISKDPTVRNRDKVFQEQELARAFATCRPAVSIFQRALNILTQITATQYGVITSDIYRSIHPLNGSPEGAQRFINLI